MAGVTDKAGRRGKGVGRWEPLFPHLCSRNGAVVEGLTGCVMRVGRYMCKIWKEPSALSTKKPSLFESGLGKKQSKQHYHNASSLPWRAVVTRDL